MPEDLWCEEPWLFLWPPLPLPPPAKKLIPAGLWRIWSLLVCLLLPLLLLLLLLLSVGRR